MSNTIAVYNFKGGVGKTSAALNLALNWSQSFKVLVIDGDPQANLTHALLGDGGGSDRTLFQFSRKIIHNGQPEIDPVVISRYLHLIPGDYQMAALESNSQFISFGHIIYYKLLCAMRCDYDFILLDCPTHFGVTVKSFIANADSILIPAIPDSFSTAGFTKLLNYLNEIKKEKSLHILGVFFNFYRKHTLLHRKIVREAEEELGDIIFSQKIRESIRVSEANFPNRFVLDSAQESAVAEDFLNLSEEVIGKFHTNTLEDLVDERGSLKSKPLLDQSLHQFEKT